VRIRLFALSFVGLTLQDTEEAKSIFDREQSILIPKPPNYFVSMIQLLRKYPTGLIHRKKVQRELFTFLAYYVLHEPSISACEKGYETDESEDEYQQKLEEAIVSVRGWDWGPVGTEYLEIIERMLRNAQTIYSI
jgi:hypothetical protein